MKCAPSPGFSLVELLISIALSVLLIGGVASMFVSSKSTYETNERLSRVEENGRFALDTMIRDLQTAGYAGCSKLATSRSTLTGTGAGLLRYESAIEAYNAAGSSTWAPTIPGGFVTNHVDGSDVIVAWVPKPGRPALRLRAPMATTTDDLQVPMFPTGHEGAFRNNEILMIADCEARVIFEVSSYNPQTGIVKHDAGSGANGSPGNSTNDFQYRFLKSSQVLSLQSVVYYVRNDAPTDPASIPQLYRRIDGGAAEPIAEGVEMLQLRFAEDTNNDRVADRNVRADEVTNQANIIGVSVALLVRAPEPHGTAESRTYQLLDTSVTKNDRYMRRVFSTTATVRNTAE
jgi:type IV pilus assembly protein PilW